MARHQLQINRALLVPDTYGSRAVLRLVNRYHSRVLRFAEPDDEDLWKAFNATLAEMIARSYEAGRSEWSRLRGMSFAYSDVRKALRKLPKRQKEAVNSLYGKIAESATKSTKARVRDRMLRGVKEFSQGDHVGYGRKLSSLRSGHQAELETIVRTQNSIAFNAAIYHDAEDEHELWGWELSTAGDERVRHSHELMDGVRYPKNHPFWRQFFPPNGWRCRCTCNPVYRDDPEAGVIVPYTHGVPDVPKEFRFNPGKLLDMMLAA